jgi:hypothetical protein
LDPVSKFPETTERSGYYVGFADIVGYALKFKILKNNLAIVLQEVKLEPHQKPVIGTKECHSSQKYKNHLNLDA